MYKTLGRRVAEYPDIAKRESQRNEKERFVGVMVLALKKEGRSINRYKEIIKDASGNQGRRVAYAMMKRIRPDYIAVIRFDGWEPPEIIMERGDKSIVDKFLKL